MAEGVGVLISYKRCVSKVCDIKKKLLYQHPGMYISKIFNYLFTHICLQKLDDNVFLFFL